MMWPLFALNFDDIIGPVITIGILILYVINHMMERGKQGQQRRQPPRRQQKEIVWEDDWDQPAQDEVGSFLDQVQSRDRQYREGRGRESGRRPPRQAEHERLAEHHIDSNIDERHISSSMGKDRFEEHLGTLDESEVFTDAHAAKQADEMDGSLAAELASMLTTPAGARQAILMHEILRRPTERWDD